MYDMQPFHEHLDPVADLVFWASIVAGPEPVWGENDQGLPTIVAWEGDTPTVHLNKDGVYMATLRYRGGDVTTMEKEERLVYLHRLHQVLKQLGTGWAFLGEDWHEESRDYPDSQWTNPVAAFLDASRRALSASGVLYESTLSLTLCWKPESTRKQKWYDGLLMTETKAQGTDTENRLAFLRQVGHLMDLLRGVVPEARWLNPDEDVTHLANMVRWERHPLQMPVIPWGLDAQLTSTHFLPGHTPQIGRILVNSDPLRLEKYVRPITVKEWPDYLGFTIPAALQTLPFPYKFTVRCLTLDKQDSESVLRDYMDKWVQMIWDGWQIIGRLFPSDAADNAASLDEALLDVKDERVTNGFCTPVVTIWADTLEELDARERTALKLLQGQNLLCRPEDVNACQALQGTWAGDLYHGVEMPPMPSLGWAFLLPHASIYGGPLRDEHFDDEVLFTTSSAGAPYRYALHPPGSKVANTHMTGPTQRGKTGMMGFQCMQFLRYALAQVFIFDVDYQLYCPTMLAGGSHYDLGTSGMAGFHVLGRIDESEDERRWAQTWLEGVLQEQGMPATPDDSLEIWAALGRVAQLPSHLRTLSAFVECFQIRRLKSALRPFLIGQAYPYLDASRDSFTFDTWTCFEMRQILKQPAALPHVLRYIFHRMDVRFDGRPTFICLDEIATIAQSTLMQAEIKDFEKTKAKKNVALLLNWQELVDGSALAIWQAIVASSENELYLPNDKILKAEVRPHYKAMGLTEGECEAIALGTRFCDYYHKTSHGSRMFQLRLSPLERLLCAASSQDEIAVMRALVAQPRTKSLCAAWLEHWGFRDEAAIFEEYYAQR